MNTHGAFIQLPGDITAFIDGIPDECHHDSKGDTVYETASGKIIYWYTYRQWAAYTSEMRDRLIYEYHEQIEDPIIMATTSCSKCKKPSFNLYDVHGL